MRLLKELAEFMEDEYLYMERDMLIKNVRSDLMNCVCIIDHCYQLTMKNF